MIPPMPPSGYRGLSLWHDTIDDIEPRPSLGADTEVDVAIVGAGYTGLWTAYHLVAADPTIRVAVIEKEVAGFGASGRNGGWCSALFPASLKRMAAERGRDAAVRMQHRLQEAVAEIGQIADAVGIDCHFDQGGYLSVARNPAQLERIREEAADHRAWGFGDEDHRLLDAHEVTAIAAVTDALGGSFTPHCAAIHPARLVRGLAAAWPSTSAPAPWTCAAAASSRRTGRCTPSTSSSRPRATPPPSPVAAAPSRPSTRS